MAHRVLAIMGILSLTCISLAQQATKLGHSSKRPDLQLIAAVTSNEPDDAQLSVRLLNRSDHALRIPVRGFICTDMPGWISAHYIFTAPANQSRYCLLYTSPGERLRVVGVVRNRDGERC